MSLPVDLRTRVLADVARIPSPSRPAARARARVTAAVTIAIAVALYFAAGGPGHGGGRPAWQLAASLLGWSAIAAAALHAALSHGGSATGRPRVTLVAVAVGTPVALFAMMCTLAAAHPEITLLHPERLGLRCLGLSLAAAAFPLVSLTAMRRGTDAVHPGAAGAARGAAGGAVAGVMVELWCPVAAPRHVLVGHVAPVALLALAGWTLGSSWLAVRAPAPQGPKK